MVTQVVGKYTGKEFGLLISDTGLTANLYQDGSSAFKVFNNAAQKTDVFGEAMKTVVAEEAGIPVARVRQTIRRDGHWALEMDYVAGAVMLEKLINAIRKEQVVETYGLLELLAELQYRIHCCTVHELPDYHSHISGAILANQNLTQEQQKHLLRELKHMPSGNQLIHGDFHPGNVVLSENGPVILDWLTAGTGDPACDVARTYLNLKHPPVPWLEDREIKVHSIYFEAYRRLSGMEFKNVERWFPFVAGMTCGGLDPVFNGCMKPYLL